MNKKMRARYLLSAVTAALVLLSALTAVTAQDTACNGYSDLCSRSYQNVAYPCTHNAYSVGKQIAANQNYDIPTQLKDGIRSLMLDAHNPQDGSSGIELCHQSCGLLDAGPLVKTLQQIVTWLKANPNEVITIFWENFDKLAPARFQTDYSAGGMLPYVYTNTNNQTWPTLQSMISSGKRVVNFIDSQVPDPNVPWLMSEYNFVFETPFQNLDPPNWQCTVDRPKDQPRSMYVLNHFLDGALPAGLAGNNSVDIPLGSKANFTNGADLEQHADKCKSTFSRIPNFIAVDFYDQGSNNVNVFEVTANLNGVPYVPKLLGNGSSSGGSGGGSSGGGTSVGISIGMGGRASASAAKLFTQLMILLGAVAAFVMAGL